MDGRQVDRKIIESVTLAASEAATNVVVHAYRDGDGGGKIEVAAAVTGQQLEVVITDDGSGLATQSESPGLGLGLSIIAGVSDSFDLLQREHGVQIRMRFSLAAAGS
jgi:anti-sigma regulatory factor (Ser/Thr protein kinase)